MKNLKALFSFVAFSVLFASCASSFSFSSIKEGLEEAKKFAESDSGKAVKGSFDALNSAAEKFTPEQEYYIGRAVAGTILENYKVYNNPKTQSYLNKICQTLVINSEKPELFKGYFVAILDTDEINAFSTCGGHVMVTRGLLDCALSEDALAAVIAHEIAHIHLEHGIGAIKSSRRTEALKILAGTAAVVASDDAEKTKELVQIFDDSIGDVVSKMISSGYSQKQEFEADKLALKLMADAGYNPKAMDEMLNVLKTKSTTKEKGFGKTHPTADSRLKNLSAEYKKYSVEDTSAARVARYNSNKIK